MERFVKVLVENFMYLILALISIMLFAWFSDGLIYGLISAISAMISYICIAKIWKDFVATGKKKSKK